MQNLTLLASNNQSFALSLDCTQVEAVYPSLSTYTFRMQIKTYATDATALIEFSTGGSSDTATYTSSSNVLQILAPQVDVASINGLKYFDIRVEAGALGEFVIAYGTIEFASGVTLSSSSGGNASTGLAIADTVLVTGSAVIAPPGVFPIVAAPTLVALVVDAAAQAAAALASQTAAANSYTALAVQSNTALAEIAAAQTTAVAAVVAAAATYEAFNQAAFLAWLNGLPTTLPATVGAWWIDGGTLAQVQP